MPTVIGPYSVADDTTPERVGLTMNGIASCDAEIVAMEKPGRIPLSYTDRPTKAPTWAWGFSTGGRVWVNPVNPDDSRGIIYTNIHEWGHNWWAKFGTKALKNALKKLAVGEFSGAYEASFSEYFADTFARAVTGGRFKGVLAHFYDVKCPPERYGRFLQLMKTMHRKPVEAPDIDEPDEIEPPPLEDPVLKLQADRDAQKLRADEAEAVIVAMTKLGAPYLVEAEEPVA